MRKFFNIFDKKRFLNVLRLIVVFSFFIVAINLIDVAYSRYESKVDMSANANVAFFVVDQGTYENSISIDGLTPRAEPFLYTINVYNYKGALRTNVTLEYTIAIETTTNLPLTYSVLRNETYSNSSTNIMTNEEIRQDEDVYYKVLSNDEKYTFTHRTNQIDQYTLVVNFPEEYKNYPNDYQGKIEMISVIIDAEQVV